MEEHAKSTPISRLPLITVLDTKNHLKDVPICQVTLWITLFVEILLLLFSINSVPFVSPSAAISFGAKFLQ